MKRLTVFESLCASMERDGTKFEDLNQGDQNLYLRLKREHDDYQRFYDSFSRSISHLPQRFLDAEHPEEFDQSFEGALEVFRSKRIRNMFIEYSSFDQYCYCVLLFKYLCKELKLEYISYLEPDFQNAVEGIGSATVGFFTCEEMDPRMSRRDMLIAKHLWERVMRDDGYTFVFSVKGGAKYSRYNTPLRDAMERFDLSEFDLSYNELRWEIA